MSDFYGGHDDEEYTHRELEDYVTKLVSDALDDGCESGVEACREVAGDAGLTVVTMRPVTAPDAWYRRQASWAVANALENWCDESFGNGEVELGPERRVRELAEERIADALRDVLGTPWHCERVGVRVLTVAEVEAMCRAEFPDWFKGEFREDAWPT